MTIGLLTGATSLQVAQASQVGELVALGATETLRMTLTQDLRSRSSSMILRLLETRPDVRLSLLLNRTPEHTTISRSILKLLWTGVKKGEEVSFRAHGEGSRELLSRIEEYNEAGWHLRD